MEAVNPRPLTIIQPPCLHDPVLCSIFGGSPLVLMDPRTLLEKRTASMEILVLGLCRTGTLSMKIALEELGYKKVYHFSTIDENQSHPDLWIAALKHKFEPPSGTPKGTLNQTGISFSESTMSLASLFNRESKIADHLITQAVTDIPAACFAPELIAAYPNAKVILTTRSATSWHRSMLQTIHALQISYVNRFLLLFADERTRKLSHLVDLVIKYYFRGSIPTHGIQLFEDHNEMVKDIALREKREFLEYRLGDGWEPLCEFLRKSVPDQEFPRVNDSASWRKAFKLDWGYSLVCLIGFLLATGFITLFTMRTRAASFLSLDGN